MMVGLEGAEIFSDTVEDELTSFCGYFPYEEMEVSIGGGGEGRGCEKVG